MEKVVCVVMRHDALSEEAIDMWTSTIAKHMQLEMRMCYYHEFDDATTFSGMGSADSRVCVFVKLVNGEPVHLHIDEWRKQFAQHSELIPFDI